MADAAASAGAGSAAADTANRPEPLARSPIRQKAPIGHHGGWEVSRATSEAPLRLCDLTSLTKVLVRAAPASATGTLLACPFGSTRPGEAGELIVGSGPDEWLLLVPAGTRPAMAERVPDPPDAAAQELVSVIDVTHGQVVIRLSGTDAKRALEKVCAIDFSDAVTPDGAAFRSSVARLACLVVRADRDGQPSYLICSDRSSGQYLFDALADAGAEFQVAVEGVGEKEI